MAEDSLIIDIGVDASDADKGINRVQKGLGDLGKSAESASKSGGFLKDAFSFAAGGAILQGVNAITGGITNLFSTAIQDSQDWTRAMTQTEAVVKSTGGAAGMTAKELGDLATAMSAGGGKGLSTAADDAVLAGENMLLTFTNIGKDVFPQTTQTLLDMVTAMNGGAAPSAEAMKNQAIQLGKALNDPIAGVSALSRVGVTFTDQQKKQIETLVNSGKTMEAQKLILAELNKEFGGSAQAAAGTFEGKMIQLSEAFHNVTGAIGDKLMPYLQKFVDWFLSAGVQDAIGKVVDALMNGLGMAFDFIGQAIQAVTPFIQQAWAWFQSAPVQSAISQIANLIGTVFVTSWNAMGTALSWVWTNVLTPVWEFLQRPEVQSAIMNIASAVGGALAGAWNMLSTAISWVWNSILVPFFAWLTSPDVMATIGNIATAVGTTLKMAWDALSTAVQWVWNSILVPFWAWFSSPEVQSTIQNIASIIGTVLVNAWNGLSSTVDFVWNSVLVPVWNWLSTNVPLVIDWFRNAWDTVSGIVTTVWNTISSTITNAFNGVKSFLETTWNAISSGWATVWNAVSSFVTNTWNTISSTVTNAFNGVKSFLETTWNAISSGWTTVWNGISSFVTTIWTTISDTVSNAIKAVKNFIDGTLTTIKTLWDTQWNAVKSFVETIWNGIKTFVQNGIDAVKGIIDRVGGTIKSAWEGLWNGISSFANNIINGIKGFVNGLVDSIKNAINWLKQLLGMETDKTSGGGGGGTDMRLGFAGDMMPGFPGRGTGGTPPVPPPPPPKGKQLSGFLADLDAWGKQALDMMQDMGRNVPGRILQGVNETWDEVVIKGMHDKVEAAGKAIPTDLYDGATSTWDEEFAQKWGTLMENEGASWGDRLIKGKEKTWDTAVTPRIIDNIEKSLREAGKTYDEWAAEMWAGGDKSGAGGSGGGGGGNPGGHGVPMAQGGTFLVKRPTTFIAGDAGPEIASFVPLGGGIGGSGDINIAVYVDGMLTHARIERLSQSLQAHVDLGRPRSAA